MTTLKLAIEELINAYGDLDAIARSLQVNAAEVAAAIRVVEQDSAEGVALRILSKYNPFIEPALSEEAAS